MGKTIKTTINVDENLWDEFSIKVIKQRGHRRKNEVIAGLIKDYVRKHSGGREGI